MPAPTHVLTSLALAVMVFLQDPGRTTFDTKLDLVVDPDGFLRRALSMWNPEGGFGELQNQAFGYLFPVGPFFALGHALGFPPWVVERSWQALLIVGAYAGAVRLADRLGLGMTWARCLGGLAYACCPRMLTTLGPLSAEALAVTMLPWIMVPLVAPERYGSPRRAAAMSALFVLLLGGANGGVTLAVLPLPLIWLVLREPSSPRRRLAAWWAVFVAAACLWWFLPLLLLGRYSPRFLDYIETAANTTAGLSPFQVLRGTTHWVAYFSRNGEPWWPAGWELVRSPLLVAVTALVAAAGLAGLTHREMPERRTWLLSVAVGFLLLGAGSVAAGGEPLQGLWRGLLDGPLVAFRNVHKFDPLVRLPLALGVVHAAAVLRSLSAERVHRPLGGVARVTVPGLALLVTLMALPLVQGRLNPGPSWTQIPPYWERAASFVAARDPDARSLLVPSSGFAEYRWGRTIDEPMQPLARSSWAVRNQVPIGAEGSTRAMDAVEQALAAGRPAEGLASLLYRSGVRFLMVRNDLDWAKVGSPRPAVVHAALDGSTGLRRIASFGPLVGGSYREDGTVVGYGLDPAYPAVEIYEVERGAVAPRTVLAGDVPVLSGGPESLLPALAGDVLPADLPAVLAGSRQPPDTGSWLLTDGLRRRDRNLGRVQGNFGATMTAEEPSRVHRRAADLLPFPAGGHQTVAMYRGIAGVSASSSAGYADSVGPTRPEFQPFSALDGHRSTSWRSGHFGRPDGQWLQVDLVGRREVGGLRLALTRDLLLGPAVTAVRVRTDQGAVTTSIEPGADWVSPKVPPGPTRRVRVTVASAAGETGGVGIDELVLPGITPSRTLLLPDDHPDVPVGDDVGPDVVVLSDDTVPRRSCLMVAEGLSARQARCDPSLERGSEDSQALDRTIDMDSGGFYALKASAIARPRVAAHRFFEPVGDGLRATASSVLGDDPMVRAGAAVDEDPSTAWVAARGDAAPELRLRWPGKRKLDSITVVPSSSTAAARPLRLRIESADGDRDVDLTAGSTVTFAPLRTSSVRVRIVAWERAVSVDPSTRLANEMAPGLAEVRFPPLVPLTYSPDLDARVGDLCGLGPDVEVDGRTVRTRVVGTLREMLEGGTVSVVTCTDRNLALGAGRHHLRVLPTDDFQVVRVVLTRSGWVVPAATTRKTSVQSWNDHTRMVEVGPGRRGLLVVPENVNNGWSARLGSRELTAVEVDGWQQAWVVPAGEGGLITLEYTPNRLHRLFLLLGLTLALGVVLAALFGGRGPAEALSTGTGAMSRWAVRGALVVPVAVGGWAGLVALSVALLVRRSARVRTAVVLASLVAATGVVVVDLVRHESLQSASGALVQVLVLTGLATALASALPSAQPSRRTT